MEDRNQSTHDPLPPDDSEGEDDYYDDIDDLDTEEEAKLYKPALHHRIREWIASNTTYEGFRRLVLWFIEQASITISVSLSIFIPLHHCIVYSIFISMKRSEFID